MAGREVPELRARTCRGRRAGTPARCARTNGGARLPKKCATTACAAGRSAERSSSLLGTRRGSDGQSGPWIGFSLYECLEGGTKFDRKGLCTKLTRLSPHARDLL